MQEVFQCFQGWAYFSNFLVLQFSTTMYYVLFIKLMFYMWKILNLKYI